MDLPGAYGLVHTGDYISQRFDREFNTHIIKFVKRCLLEQTSPGRLVADHLLLAGQLIGQHKDPRYLAKPDKR